MMRGNAEEELQPTYRVVQTYNLNQFNVIPFRMLHTQNKYTNSYYVLLLLLLVHDI